LATLASGGAAARVSGTHDGGGRATRAQASRKRRLVPTTDSSFVPRSTPGVAGCATPARMPISFVLADSPKVSVWPVVLLWVHAQVMVVPEAMGMAGLYFSETGSFQLVPL